MPRSVRLTPLESVPEGEGRVFAAGDRELALFRMGTAVHALDNACPHAGGPLGLGFLDGEAVVCPLHGWRFDLASGHCRARRSSVAVYPARVEDGWIVVELPDG